MQNRKKKRKKKKSLPHTAPSLKTRYSLFLLTLSSPRPSFALQEKTFKNGVLVTSGEQRVTECWLVRDLARGHLPARAVSAHVPARLRGIGRPRLANGSESTAGGQRQQKRRTTVTAAGRRRVFVSSQRTITRFLFGSFLKMTSPLAVSPRRSFGDRKGRSCGK